MVSLGRGGKLIKCQNGNCQMEPQTPFCMNDITTFHMAFMNSLLPADKEELEREKERGESDTVAVAYTASSCQLVVVGVHCNCWQIK